MINIITEFSENILTNFPYCDIILVKEYEAFTNLILCLIPQGESMLVPYKYPCGFLFEEIMGKKYDDLTANKYGKLAVIERAISTSKKDKHAYWKCLCDCGNYAIVASHRLKGGETRSCGCINNGKSYTRLYRIWNDMKKRCYIISETAYHNYGGRGIIVCDEWLHDFQAFYDWSMANGYREDLTIDRIEVNGNYEPSNCRWVTRKVQNNNTRRNHYLSFDGTTKSVAEWADITGIKQNTLLYRIRRGWSVERALTTR